MNNFSNDIQSIMSGSEMSQNNPSDSTFLTETSALSDYSQTLSTALSDDGGDDDGSPSSSLKGNKVMEWVKKNKKLLLISGIGGSVVVGILLFAISVGLSIYMKKQKKKKTSNHLPMEPKAALPPATSAQNPDDEEKYKQNKHVRFADQVEQQQQRPKYPEESGECVLVGDRVHNVMNQSANRNDINLPTTS